MLGHTAGSSLCPITWSLPVHNKGGGVIIEYKTIPMIRGVVFTLPFSALVVH